MNQTMRLAQRICAASYAHDYDDVQLAMSGHPTVPVAPVVFEGEHRVLIKKRPADSTPHIQHR